MSFGYSLETPKASEIACGIAPWQGEYGPENTLVLDGKMGQNLIRLAPQGCSFTHYAIYLPDGTVYDDGTREMYSSLSPMAMNSQEGVCLIAPFQPGEYIYEVELSWPEEGLTVIYGLKVIMTGEESEYDRARNSVFQAYGEGNPQIAVSLVKKFTLANAVYSSPRFVFKVENIPDGPLWVEVSATDGKILGEYKYYDVVVAPSCAGDAPTYFDSGPVETVNGNRKTYYRNTDGTWQVDGRTYQYRLEITGRMHNAAADSTFVYLSNVEEITFDQAWRAAGLSSNSADYFPVEVAVLVEWRTGEKTEVGGVDYPGSVSITPTP